MAAPAAIAIQGALTLLKSKWFWIGVGVLVLFIVIVNQWENIQDWWRESTQKKDIVLTKEEEINIKTTGKAILDTKEIELKTLAELLWSDIYDTPLSGHNHDLYTEALDLSDTQLKFMSKYYRQYVSSNIYLYEDIDNELFSPFTSIDSKLMSKLATVGEKSFA